MKTVTFIINNAIIELSNDWTGYETVYVNGQKVSKKFSWTGTTHKFTFEGEKFTVNTAFNFTTNEVKISVFSDKRLVEEKLTKCFDYTTEKEIQNSFYWGLLFATLCVIFDWNKVFLLVSVCYMLGMFNTDSNCKTTTELSKTKKE